MPIPLLIPLIAAGVSAASPFIGRALAGKKPRRPDAPDLVAPLLAELSNRRSELERDLQFRNQRDIEATRASGVNSVVASGFRNQTSTESNDLRRRLDSIIADRIDQAERQQQQINYDVEQARFQDNLTSYNNRAQAISNGIQSVTSIASLAATGGLNGLGGAAGASGGSGAAASILPSLAGPKVGLTNTQSASLPSLFNYQDSGISNDIQNRLYIQGRSNNYNAPSLGYSPPNYNTNPYGTGSGNQGGLFQFQGNNYNQYSR